jgi:hypothetical protein
MDQRGAWRSEQAEQEYGYDQKTPVKRHIFIHTRFFALVNRDGAWHGICGHRR